MIDMTPDGALSWRFDDVQPGAVIDVPVYIAAGSTRQEAYDTLAKAKSQPEAHWRELTISYWHGFLAAAVPAPAASESVRELYERSLLGMKLMSDERSGSVVAAPEFDEASPAAAVTPTAGGATPPSSRLRLIASAFRNCPPASTTGR